MRLSEYLKSSLLVILSGIVIYASSCKKEQILQTGGQVTFSIDTLMFDTVFTAQGSATRSIRIFNPQKETIQISSIRLRKGEASPYMLNVNGMSGKEVQDIKVAGNDSAWIFAAVNIDPTHEDNPFVVTDELIVTMNGHEFTIPFIAFGQNAHYIVDSVLQTQTWLTDKPYVIIHNALVDEGQTLTIPAGVRVYMHQDSRLYVLGTLKIRGTKTDSVVFQGDRLDPLVWIGDYLDIPGQWGGLYFFRESHNNEIDYAVFKNGGASTRFFDNRVLDATIQVDRDTILNGIPKLKITNSVISSSQGYGIVSFGGSIEAENCRIVECGAENIMMFEGGNYQFYDCTIGTYGSRFLSHSKNYSMAVLNYYPTSQTTYISGPLVADIKNCIIYGSLKDELFIDAKPDHTATATLENCLFKISEPLPAFVGQAGNILNEDPLFKDREKGDYHLQEGSPAIGKGISAGSLSTDMDGVSRSNPPSIGCYEYQP